MAAAIAGSLDGAHALGRERAESRTRGTGVIGKGGSERAGGHGAMTTRAVAASVARQGTAGEGGAEVRAAFDRDPDLPPFVPSVGPAAAGPESGGDA
jgi:hypothetical protein